MARLNLVALQTGPDSPAPLRQVAALIGGWVGRLGTIWVEAEVAQLNRRRGVSFLVLRDLSARISVNATCHASVLDAVAVPVTEGARVIVNVKPEYYEPNGSLALSIREIRPTGEGELLAQLERRRQLLAAEGLFDPRLKRPLPVLPRAIGLVTGKDSAAERDVVQNVRLRWPDAVIVTRHALVQGPSAAGQVIDAVEALDADPQVDVIVIARGGGSVEDLLPFSDEALVRAVHAITTPVVSAIGHEPDTPILDLVADLRASTPTDAAKRIVPDVADELRHVAMACARMRQAVAAAVHREQQTLDQLRSRPVLLRPATIVDGHATELAQYRDRCTRAMTHRLDRATDEIGHHLARVRALSPLATLERGYAVALGPSGQAVTRTALVAVDDTVTIHVTDGRLVARITAIEEQPHD